MAEWPGQAAAGRWCEVGRLCWLDEAVGIPACMGRPGLVSCECWVLDGEAAAHAHAASVSCDAAAADCCCWLQRSSSCPQLEKALHGRSPRSVPRGASRWCCSCPAPDQPSRPPAQPADFAAASWSCFSACCSAGAGGAAIDEQQHASAVACTCSRWDSDREARSIAAMCSTEHTCSQVVKSVGVNCVESKLSIGVSLDKRNTCGHQQTSHLLFHPVHCPCSLP